MQGYKRRAKRVAELCQFGYRSRSDDFAIGIETAGEPRSCEPVHLSHEALLAYVQRMTATLTAQACSDSLTGVANRRAFDERLAEESARGARLQHTFAVVPYILRPPLRCLGCLGVRDVALPPATRTAKAREMLHRRGDLVVDAVSRCYRSL